MSEPASPTLLPEGLRDVLPPDAAGEADLVERLAASFDLNGYDRVAPPLVEFESTLLAGMGAVTAARIFRMVDPISQRTLGIRADVTAQIARLVSTRLQSAPRPLRLMYAGQVLRVKGHQLRPERQFTQVGFELVGPDSVAADAESIIVAVEAVAELGVKNISVDLALPPLVLSLLELGGFSEQETDTLKEALNHKDSAEIRRLGGKFSDTLSLLVEASGPLKIARPLMEKIDLPENALAHLRRLFAVADIVKSQASNIAITVDLVENRGLQYHTGVTFFLFAKGSTREIGRGGRYNVEHGEGVAEPATGATLFMDSLLTVSPSAAPSSCVYLPFETTREEVSRLQSKGLRVRVSLSEEEDPLTNAIELGCSHMMKNGQIVEVSK